MSAARLLHGDALAVLKTLPAESVRCAVTSPPYWGLRDYGTARWEGGDDGCEHAQRRTIGSSTLRNDGRERIGTQEYEKTAATVIPFRDTCGKCGARRIDAQLGLERTPEEYVARLVGVFREVRRVLTPDGTLFLNVGDSYNSIGHKKSGSGYGTTGLAGGIAQEHTPLRRENSAPGLKHKDLVGIPWRVAFALQADGWWLRSDIIWSKPNPMPESVTDRPTRAHEYVFLLSKAARYYYDAAAIRQPLAESSVGRINQESFDQQTGGPKDYGHRTNTNRSARKAPCNLKEKLVRAEKWGDRYAGWETRDKSIGANARSVWEIATQPYPEAHFATFPEELAQRCILAGSAPGDTVLDPFCGSGTTCAVAVGHGRDAIGIDLNPKYLELARQRIGPLLCVDVAS